MSLFIGTASWSIPAQAAGSFIGKGSVLERYASRFPGVEINSSFYRAHRPSTWARWSASVPAGFRFAVKMPKTITHERKLVDCSDLLKTFLGEVSALGSKFAVLLVQLPPSFSFQNVVVTKFFELLSTLTSVRVVCEPRHISWFGDEAENAFRKFGIARVAADPALIPKASVPGGHQGLSYFRLHGSPIMYRSAYGDDRLTAYAELIRKEQKADREVWCIFDNTALAAATSDALTLWAQIGPS